MSLDNITHPLCSTGNVITFNFSSPLLRSSFFTLGAGRRHISPPAMLSRMSWCKTSKQRLASPPRVPFSCDAFPRSVHHLPHSHIVFRRSIRKMCFQNSASAARTDATDPCCKCLGGVYKWTRAETNALVPLLEMCCQSDDTHALKSVSAPQPVSVKNDFELLYRLNP